MPWAPTPFPLSAHQSTECECTASRIETLICTCHTTHQFVWRLRSGWTILRDSVLSSPTLAPTLLEWLCQGQRGSALTASSPVSDISAPAYTNGYGHFWGLWVWRRKQTVHHVVLKCPIHRLPHGLHDLTFLDDDTIEWLFNTCPKIQCGQAVDKKNWLIRWIRSIAVIHENKWRNYILKAYEVLLIILCIIIAFCCVRRQQSPNGFSWKKPKLFQAALRKFQRFSGSLQTGTLSLRGVMRESRWCDWGTFLEHVCQAVGYPGRHSRSPGPGWCRRSIGGRKKLSTPFGACNRPRWLVVAQEFRLSP